MSVPRSGRVHEHGEPAAGAYAESPSHCVAVSAVGARIAQVAMVAGQPEPSGMGFARQAASRRATRGGGPPTGDPLASETTGSRTSRTAPRACSLYPKGRAGRPVHVDRRPGSARPPTTPWRPNSCLCSLPEDRFSDQRSSSAAVIAAVSSSVRPSFLPSKAPPVCMANRDAARVSNRPWTVRRCAHDRIQAARALVIDT